MNRVAYCHFCDDVRLEVGNKSSLMGVYGGDLQVPSFPYVLPKFAVVTFIRTHIDKPISTLVFEVRDGSDVLVRHEVPPEELASAQRTILARDDGSEPAQAVALGATTFLSPLSLNQPTVVKAVVICDGEEMIAGKLYVRQMDQALVPAGA
ncbi:DUF6941 family protein [Paraburkholderia silvatlantica]|uniref:Uncharacterized protein n=1 Tax=Paraburkholderia silvatlantica TaxID=321895 RepID=A0ABR6FVA0_9BURK|nr:hypothetical protein [Paraburkholderia silvatlantica]MBB2930992.1 hypothetical protein [Paraburkholderia silvatlantica]PVY26971.1 hypothetical protein C7411_12119 [Paraburkholderia silvatlantica]PXW33247.1 hypothetical protein C7413_12019 [Paraburkholderia silvatlantica]